MKKQKGFSLIELLIVVAIILIIAAIAIPNLIKSKIAANEASAVGSLRTINTSELTYSSTYGTGFTSLATLGTTAVGLVDPVLGAGTKSGFSITADHGAVGTGTTSDPWITYASNGDPLKPNVTGTRHFCSDESGVIRWLVGAACVGGTTPTGAALQ